MRRLPPGTGIALGIGMSPTGPSELPARSPMLADERIGTPARSGRRGVGVLWDSLRIPASGTVAATYVARDAGVNAAELQYAAGVDLRGKAAALADLRALGIIAC